MYLRFPIFRLLPSCICSTSKIVLISSQCNLLSQQLCKVTTITYDLGSIWNFAETWKTMSTTVFQSFNSFNSIKWEILLLPWSHLKLGLEHKMTYNSLSTTPNFMKFWETHHIYVFYIFFKILALLMMTTKSNHFQKKLTSKLRLKL
jgi:hypothetical protein